MTQKNISCIGQLQDNIWIVRLRRVPSGGKRTPHPMAEHLGRAPAISGRMPSWLLEALPRSTGGAKKTPATDLYCCKRLIIWKNVHYLKRGNRVESSLAILPIVVRLPLVLQRTSAAGTKYWSQTRFTRVQRHSYSSSPTKACTGTCGIGRCIRECKRGVAESVNGCSTVMDINLGGRLSSWNIVRCRRRSPQSGQLPITEDQCTSNRRGSHCAMLEASPGKWLISERKLKLPRNRAQHELYPVTLKGAPFSKRFRKYH